jgi:hypothetical protein
MISSRQPAFYHEEARSWRERREILWASSNFFFEGLRLFGTGAKHSVLRLLERVPRLFFLRHNESSAHSFLSIDATLTS